jgi:hypothetical protein
MPRSQPLGTTSGQRSSTGWVNRWPYGARVPVEELAKDVRRVADRLRSLTGPRLGADCPPYGTVADAGRAAASALAEAGLVLTGRAPRSLPRLGDFAVGDQVAVTGQELLDALAAADPAQLPPEAAQAADVLADVRRRI